MKRFDQKLKNFLQSELGHKARLYFLHCNANFLLGLSRACGLALGAMEDDLIQQGKFSRANSSASKRWKMQHPDLSGPHETSQVQR